jgi:hypothetical protein
MILFIAGSSYETVVFACLSVCALTSEQCSGTEEIFWHNSMKQSPLLQKLIVAWLFKKIPAFYKTRGSLPCSQKSVTEPSSEPNKSSPHPPTSFLQHQFQYHAPRYNYIFQRSLPFSLSIKMLYAFLIAPICATWLAHLIPLAKFKSDTPCNIS